MFTFIIFVIILGLLVLAHEFGHFITARIFGMRVEEFGFGLPPRAFGIKKIGGKWKLVRGNGDVTSPSPSPYKGEGVVGSTMYSLNWLPIGGFVKIKGENGEAQSENDSFMSKPAWQKTIVLAAGVTMNIILAAVLLGIGYMFGLPQNVDEMKDISNVKERRIEIMQVLPGKPAELAGLKAGDVLVQVGELQSPRLKAMQDYINVNRDKEIAVSVKRGNEIITQNIKPAYNSESGRAGIGVAIAEIGLLQYPWYSAFYHGFITAIIFLKEIFIAFYFLIAGLFRGAGVGDAVSGPIGIAVMTGQVARMGFSYLIQFAAMLSLNLAVINILPIPALDGGRILFTWLGKIFRRPVFMRFEQAAHTIGFALLMILILAVTIKDIGTFKGFFIGLFHKIF